jgi:hypothetical protein
MADIPALVQYLVNVHDRDGKPIALCMSDGTKWQVWYDAELALKVNPEERLKDRGCFAQIPERTGWLMVYDAYCGGSRDDNDKRNIVKETNYLFLSSDDCPPSWASAAFGSEPRLVIEYPVSHWRLYAL